MKNTMTYLELEQRGDVGLLWINDPEEKMNVLKAALMEELKQVLDHVQAEPKIKALVLCSRKEQCFIAGADINMFQDYPAPDVARARAAQAHALLQQLGSLRVPTVAALRGIALGGGLEIAMACQYRIAANDSQTYFGLPEVKLGLLPGLGGTQRLPQLVGLQAALDMLLTGKNVYPSKAKKLGLVDALCHAPGLVEAACKFALEKAARPGRKARKRNLTTKLLESGLGRGLLFRMAAKTVQKQTAGNYPAPFKIIDCVRTGWVEGQAAGIQAEIGHFDELVRGSVSKSLVSLFFGMTDNKKNPAKDLVRSVKQIGVLGAGLMGSGIAEVSIQKNYQVFLKDLNNEALGRGEKAIYDTLNKKVQRRTMTTFERDLILARLAGTTENKSLAQADIVIEAVFEDLNLKRKILAETEAATPAHCIFASNTSAIPISEIAAHAKRPDQVIGMHYFSPVGKMPLLEIIVTDKTADWVTATAVEIGIRQGKTVIVVGDGPGFYTTRILAPLMNEAVILLAEGADIREIDKAMFQAGFPVGPVKLMDEVGIDVGAHVGDTFAPMLAARGVEATNHVKTLYEAGYHGRKNQKGFYRYDLKKGNGKVVNEEIYRFFGGSQRKHVAKEEIQERLLLAMVNEAVYCLQEGILRSPTDGDLGAILGLGFPPFLGGPFHYLDSVGVPAVLAKFEKWQASKGARFKPAPLLQEYKTKKFHT